MAGYWAFETVAAAVIVSEVRLATDEKNTSGAVAVGWRSDSPSLTALSIPQPAPNSGASALTGWGPSFLAVFLSRTGSESQVENLPDEKT